MKYILPPDQQRVALKWSGTFNEDISSFTSFLYGVVNPGTKIPKYWDQYFGIYKYAYIEKTQFQFQISSVGDNRPIRVVLAESNTQDVTPTTFLELAETPRSKQKILQQGGNHAVVILNHTTKGDSIMGHRLEDDEAFWNTQSGAPVAPIQPLVALGLETVVPGGGAQVNWMVTITYHIKFFTLNHL